jgi:hypothetical protein
MLGRANRARGPRYHQVKAELSAAES